MTLQFTEFRKHLPVTSVDSPRTYLFDSQLTLCASTYYDLDLWYTCLQAPMTQVLTFLDSWCTCLPINNMCSSWCTYLLLPMWLMAYIPPLTHGIHTSLDSRLITSLCHWLSSKRVPLCIAFTSVSNTPEPRLTRNSRPPSWIDISMKSSPSPAEIIRQVYHHTNTQNPSTLPSKLHRMPPACNVSRSHFAPPLKYMRMTSGH